MITIQDVHISTRTGETLVNRLNFEVAPGEVLGLIGESGSGKSLTAKAIMGLLPEHLSVQGQVYYRDHDLLSMPFANRRKLLGKEIGLIFQDYRGSFTPFIKVGKQLVETIVTHTNLSKKEAQKKVDQVLAQVGLDPARVYRRYPFQLSGGQIQRAAIAMALALKPSLLICDEITTALDVMNAEKVMNYIDQVQRETGCAVLLITHDLAQAYRRTNRMCVMHQGQIVEKGVPVQIRDNPQHPYTKRLSTSLLALPEEEAHKKRESVGVL
nr:ABC transporter ATP-binding protein [Caldalkalibacillus salinus]